MAQAICQKGGDITIFVVGLDLESGISSRFVTGIRHPMAVMDAIQVAVGLAALAMLPSWA
jgi:hypothetical protein